jgi:hypothetical protein
MSPALRHRRRDKTTPPGHSSAGGVVKTAGAIGATMPRARSIKPRAQRDV